MSRNATDKQLQERLESLTALQAGIVFGKDDAWDKLQQRLQPQRKRPVYLGYISAIAAMLLAVVLLVALWPQHKQPSGLATNATEAVKGVATMVGGTNEPIRQLETTAIMQNNIPATKATTLKYPTRPTVAPSQTATNGEQLQPTQPVLSAEQPTVATNTQPKVKLGIVHINDIENDPTTAADKTADAPTETTIVGMPIVHINQTESKPLLYDAYRRTPGNISVTLLQRSKLPDADEAAAPGPIQYNSRFAFPLHKNNK